MITNYTIAKLSRALYDAHCDAHRGKDPKGAPLPCWAALSASERKCWWTTALAADQQVREQVHLDRDRLEARRRTRAKRSAP